MRRAAERKETGSADDLFARIGAFLTEQRLSPEPAHYSFAYDVLKDPQGALAQAVARLTDDGVRLSRSDIESLGGRVRAGAPFPAEPSAAERGADRLVGEAQAQVEGVATIVRAMHDEARDFGRDLAEHAAAMHRADPVANMAELARITGAMLSRIHEAEHRLAGARQETEELRAKLAEARIVARRDPLTGLPNRRAFEEAFAQAQAGPVCVALADVDRFKRINDGFGHGVGDRVLSAIADTLRVACDGHMVARHGGEEFAVLTRGLSIGAVEAMLEDARAGVAAKRFRTRESDMLIGRVTMSVGLTVMQPGEPLEEAVARADRLLYRAKSTGRDKLCRG